MSIFPKSPYMWPLNVEWNSLVYTFVYHSDLGWSKYQKIYINALSLFLELYIIILPFHTLFLLLICIKYLFSVRASQVVLVVKSPPANVGDIGDPGLTPGSRRSLGAGQGKPLQYCCLENPTDRGAWRATVHRVAQSWTQLKPLSTAQYILCKVIQLLNDPYFFSVGF